MAVDLIPAAGLFGTSLIFTPSPLLAIAWEPNAPARAIAPGNLDTITSALNRLYWQWSDKPNWVALATIIGTVYQSSVTEQWQIAQLRYLSTATDSTLDEIGALVGLDRLGIDENLYRRAIRARGATTVGDAGIDAVMAPAKAILGAGNVSYVPAYPRAYCYAVTVALTVEMLELLVRLLSPVPGNGIGAKILLAPPDSPGMDWATPQAWAASWSSAYGAVDASVAAPWSWAVALT